MNANRSLRPIRNFTRNCLVASILALSSGAVAQADDSNGDPLSAIGVERGLELYDRDAADPCRADRTQVRVYVTNVHKEGLLKLELFGEEDFMKSSGKLRRIRVPAEDEPMLVCIDVPEPGEYAVVGYHDLDADRRLDKKWNFRPKEPYGLSNNPVIESLRLPKWDETRFAVPSEGVNIAIGLVDMS